MKLTFNIQILISVLIVLIGNILSTVFAHWIFRSAGFVVCGFFFLLHPVLPKGVEMSPKAILWTRMTGVVFILIGVFTRSYL